MKSCGDWIPTRKKAWTSARSRGASKSVHWAGAFGVYGGHGATASSTIVYEIEPGHRLGWHNDATEETQYIIDATGELHMENGSTYQVGAGSVFAIQTPAKHDL